MLFQTKLFAPPATTPEAEMQQKIMKYMMIFMGVMFYKVPSGLGIYFITSSLWAIGERLAPSQGRSRHRKGAGRETCHEREELLCSAIAVLRTAIAGLARRQRRFREQRRESQAARCHSLSSGRASSKRLAKTPPTARSPTIAMATAIATRIETETKSENETAPDPNRDGARRYALCRELLPHERKRDRRSHSIRAIPSPRSRARPSGCAEHRPTFRSKRA